MKDLYFTDETYYVGRNGQGRQTGISLTIYDDQVRVKPINSKNEIANCLINIPIKDLPKVINTLQSLTIPDNGRNRS